VGSKEIGEGVQYGIDDVHHGQKVLKKAQVKLASTLTIKPKTFTCDTALPESF
jgi:hypothetical protein